MFMRHTVYYWIFTRLWFRSDGFEHFFSWDGEGKQWKDTHSSCAVMEVSVHEANRSCRLISEEQFCFHINVQFPRRMVIYHRTSTNSGARHRFKYIDVIRQKVQSQSRKRLRDWL